MNYVIRVSLENENVLLVETLERITNIAMIANTEFMGMGFQNSQVVLRYKNRPIQYTKIKKEIIALLNAY